VSDREADDRDEVARHERARRQALAYQGAFEAVAAILIGAGLGYWADSYFDTSPFLLLIGTGFGFASFVVRLLRLGKLLQKLDAESDDPR